MKSDKGRGGVIVQPYRGYGSHKEAFVMGRVFRQPGTGRRWEEGGTTRDLVDVARRIIRRGVRDARIIMLFCGTIAIWRRRDVSVTSFWSNPSISILPSDGV